MFYPHTASTAVEVTPGLTRRVLATSEQMMVVEFSFETGAQVPEHRHPHDQVGYVVSGRMQLTIGEETAECGPGDSYHAPPNVPHTGRALEATVLIDIFSPPREDFR